MPWKATDPMKERVKFILEWERRVEETRDQVNLAVLCPAPNGGARMTHDRHRHPPMRIDAFV